MKNECDNITNQIAAVSNSVLHASHSLWGESRGVIHKAMKLIILIAWLPFAWYAIIKEAQWEDSLTDEERAVS